MTKSIKYKGQLYPVKVGYYALSKTSDELKNKNQKLKLEDLSKGDLSILEPLFYHSLVMGCHLEDKKLTIPRENAAFVLDGCLAEFLEMIPEFMGAFTGGDSNEKKLKAGTNLTPKKGK